MAKLNKNNLQIKLKQGVVANINADATKYLATEGEPHYATDTKDLYIFDGTNNQLVGGLAALDAKVDVAGDTMTGALIIDGTADTQQLTVQAHSTQTANLQETQNSAGTILTKTSGVGVFFPLQAATASAPAYVKGGLYFDLTLNKLMVGGASGWETVTSA